MPGWERAPAGTEHRPGETIHAHGLVWAAGQRSLAGRASGSRRAGSARSRAGQRYADSPVMAWPSASVWISSVPS